MRALNTARLGLASLLCLCACAGQAGSSGEAPHGDPHELVGQPAPPLVGLTRDGFRFDLATLEGRVVLVDFWATWCGPCKDEMPELEALYQEYAGRGLVVVGVSVDEDDEGIDEFASSIPVSFPLVHDAEQTIAAQWSPPNMPSTFLVDRGGRVVWMHGGFSVGEADLLRHAVTSQLGGVDEPERAP